MYCGLKSWVLALNIACFSLLFVAVITDRWIVWTSIPANLGLLRYCDPSGCGFLAGYADSAFGLLLASALMAIALTLPCAIWEVSYAKKGRLGCLSYVACLQFLIGILAFAGMLDGTILLGNLAKREEEYSNYSWSYALGWLGVVSAFGAGGLSIYINRIEPRDPVNETQISKQPENWQPEVPQLQPPNADWQPHLPELQPTAAPAEGSQQGSVQPQHFTWRPNQAVPNTQETPWQPQPQNLAPPPLQGDMEPQKKEPHLQHQDTELQQAACPYQQGEIKPLEEVCLPPPEGVEPQEAGSQYQTDGIPAYQTTGQLQQEGL